MVDPVLEWLRGRKAELHKTQKEAMQRKKAFHYLLTISKEIGGVDDLIKVREEELKA